MKKLIFLILISGFSLCASAQLEVNKRGQVLAGKYNKSLIGVDSLKFLSPYDENTKVSIDTTANIVVLGSGPMYTGGSMCFGLGDEVSIAQINVPVTAFPQFNPLSGLSLKLEKALSLKGNRIQMKNDSSTFFDARSGKVRFYSDVQVDGLFVSSDSRLKSNIEPVADRIADLSEISAVSYNLGSTDARMSAQQEAT